MTQDNDRGWRLALALLAAAIPMMIYQAWAMGFVAERMWQWFAVAELHVRPIGWKVWSALFIMYGMLRYRGSKKKEERPKSELAAELILWLIFPWIALALGMVLR